MHPDSNDQATGLRELLKRSRQRLLPVLGAGGPHQWFSALLADTLARSGQRVLVIEQGSGDCARLLGAAEAPTLADAMAGRCDLERALHRSPTGAEIAVLGASGAGRHVLEAVSRSNDPADLILLHCSDPRTVARFLDAEGEILLVTGGTPEAVQAAYLNIKRTCAWPHRYRTVVVGERNESSALRVHERIAATAERFLGVAAAFGGFVPQQLARHQLPVDPMRSAVARLASAIPGWNLAEFRRTRAQGDARAAPQ